MLFSLCYLSLIGNESIGAASVMDRGNAAAWMMTTDDDDDADDNDDKA